MRCLVTGASRSGTNLLTEYVRAAGVHDFTEGVEDRTFFKRGLPEGYGTKLATENAGYTCEALHERMTTYPDLQVFFSLRHPVDCCVSKMARQRHVSIGGDHTEPRPSATCDEVLIEVLRADDVLQMLTDEFPSRLFKVKMEDIVLHTWDVCYCICKSLGVRVPDNMHLAHRNNRNRFQRGRYGNELSQDVVNLRYRSITAFEGFFAGRMEIVDRLCRHTASVVKRWGY